MSVDPAETVAAIEPGLAPGGLVFETWIGDERLFRTAIPFEQLVDAKGLATRDGKRALERCDGHPVILLVYDGDDGSFVQAFAVEPS